MKRFYTLFVVLIIFSCFITTAPAQVGSTPDPHLIAAVRALLGVTSGGSIPWSELELFYDPLYSNQITTLNGLEHATNLKHLDLRHNNELRDITAIAGLTQLKELGLTENQISDITPLTGLTQLETLNISWNQISDISPLAGLKNLKTLTLDGNQISDISPLTGLTQLKGLSMTANQINDITPLTGLTNLEELYLSGNQISDFAPFTGLTQLNKIAIGYAQISDITPLVESIAELPKLENINLEYNQISDITPLAGLTQLNKLRLENNQISDIKPLEGLTQLKGLTLTCNQISDITPLARLTQLEGIGLGFNQISDIKPLARLTHLKGVDLSSNQISDISPLTRLTALEWLDLGENQVAKSDRRRLRLLPNLTQLRFDGEQLGLYGIDISSVLDGRFTKAYFVVSPRHFYPCHVENSVQDQDMPPQVSGEDTTQNTALPVSVFVDAEERPPLYWIDTESGTLHGLTGAEVEGIAPNVQNATSLAIDAATGKLYWTEKTSDTTGKIWRANLDGSNVELVKELTSVPLGIVLDLGNGKLYVPNAWGKIQRMNFDGTDFQPNLITGLVAPQHITIAVAGGKLYWTEKTGDTTGRIQRANLDGSNAELVKELTSVPLGIAIDTENNKLYVTNTWGKIQQINLDGTGFQPNFITGLDAPKDLAVEGNKVYWIEGSSIRRASLTGENIEDVVTGLRSPTALVLGIVPPSDDMPSPTDVPEPTTDTAADINNDGVVNIQDLVLVASSLGKTGQNVADVNADEIVDIRDLVKVAGALGNAAAAPSLHPQLLQTLTTADVQQWLSQAQHLDLTDITSQRGIRFLEQLLAMLIPKETVLLPNYPNPFNPETWIPYQLATDTDVQFLIYDARGVVVRRLALGHQSAGFYIGASRAAYWNGRNSLGERVASGIYFYQLLTNEASSMRKMVILK